MAILITGGTGKTGQRVARILAAHRETVYIASRSANAPEPFVNVKFDWLDVATHPAPFATAADAGHHIDAIYLVAPSVNDMLAAMKPFIDRAVQEGVKRFVLLSGAITQKGDPAMGEVHAYLDEQNLDYCVIRPSWFFENFTEGHLFPLIKVYDNIHTAAGEGCVPWISADEIAQVAAEALTSKQVEHREFIIGGPELLSFNQVATIFSEVLGRPITITKVSPDEIKSYWIHAGAPESLAAVVSMLDHAISVGLEEKFSKAEPRFDGHHTIREFIESNKQMWAKEG